MTTSSTITKLSAALLAAQKSIGAAKKGSVNPFFHSNYASLGDVMEACKEILNDNGITVLQPLTSDEHGVYVQTVLLHESGEFISADLRIAPKSDSDPQDQGSAITYGRRYGLQSMVFIPAEDDDGEKAVAPIRKAAQSSVDDEKASGGAKFCATHPTGFLGKDQWGNYYKTCVKGKALNEKCDIQDAGDPIPERDINEDYQG